MVSYYGTGHMACVDSILTVNYITIIFLTYKTLIFVCYISDKSLYNFNKIFNVNVNLFRIEIHLTVVIIKNYIGNI